MSLNREKIFLIFGFALGAIIFTFNWLAISHNCFNGYDYAIYQQAAFEIGAFNDWNPFLTIRNLKIFNDHFDPVVIFAGLFSRLVNYIPHSLMIFEFLISCLAIMLLWFWGRRQNTKNYYYVPFLFFLSRGILNTLFYPVHASTWSLPIFVWVVWSYLQNRRWSLAIACTLLCLFKENFALGLIGLSVGLLFQGKLEKRKDYFGISLFLICVGGMSLLFSFKIRPLIMGPVFDYGGGYLEQILKQPKQFFLSIFNNNPLGETLKILFPLGLLSLYLWVGQNKKGKIQFGVLGCFLLPLFLLQIVTRGLTFQYSFPFFIVLLSIWVFSSEFEKNSLPKYQKKFGLILAVFLLTSISKYTKALEFLIWGRGQKCVVHPMKSESKEKITTYLNQKMLNNSKDHVAVSGGMVNSVLAPGRKVYHIESHSPKVSDYQFLILELNDSGDTYPLNKREIDKIKEDCDVYSNEKIVDNQFFYFARGEFPGSCINQFNKI